MTESKLDKAIKKIEILNHAYKPQSKLFLKKALIKVI